MRTFDRKVHFDPRSLTYPVRPTLPRLARPRNKLWRLGPILDQGQEGACVGFGWTGEAVSTPVAVDFTRLAIPAPSTPQQFAFSLYDKAKTLDEWPGENYEGSSVLAGAKAMQFYGLLREYRWALSIQDVIDSVLVHGPVVLGINWHEDMYEPVDGVLSASGPVVGGHCLTVAGYRLRSPKLGGEDGLILRNSWGPDWGANGTALIRIPELESLLKDNGEACVPVHRSYGR